jgi:hypothetical protein
LADWQVVISVGIYHLRKLAHPDKRFLVMQTHERIRLVLVETGRSESFERYVRENGWKSGWSLGKWVCRDSAYLHAADVFGFASKPRQWGAQPWRAMAAGLP